ncbi:MAG: response regulator [Candidatus Binatus sp.]|nr:response regulator [Candidatus Binatus sp.]MDO8430797.1 response regulator [Candidatus Binatus sp.]
MISDIGMPGADGLMLIRKIRQKPNPLGDIPGLALTAYGRIDDKIDILEAGYQAHVIKPVDVAELTAIIASLIRKDDERRRSK